MRLRDNVGFIYGIKVLNKYYIGLSNKSNLTSRYNEHLSEKRKYRQVVNYILQSARKHTYFIITLCNSDDIEDCEVYWIKEYDSHHNGWNSTTGGESKKSGDRSNLSLFWKERYENGYESKRKGSKHTEETKRKIGELASVRYKGNGNPRWEKGTPVVCLTLDGDLVKIFYGGTRQAEREMHVSHTHISNVCKHKPHCHTLGGFKWVYLFEYIETNKYT